MRIHEKWIDVPIETSIESVKLLYPNISYHSHLNRCEKALKKGRESVNQMAVKMQKSFQIVYTKFGWF